MSTTPSPAPRVRLDLDARREQLMRIGLELFSTNSYDAVSIDEIAARAGISKGLLYHYFPSKREFYVAGVRAAAAQLREVVEPDPELPLRSEPTTLLRLAMEGWVGYVEATSLSWLERRTVPRERLRELLFNTFLVVVGAAVQADPALELDLAALGGGAAQP